jgi:hypothetical protein
MLDTSVAMSPSTSNNSTLPPPPPPPPLLVSIINIVLIHIKHQRWLRLRQQQQQRITSAVPCSKTLRAL